MIQTGIFTTCDQCGFQEKVPSLDHIPGSWYALHTVAGKQPAVPKVCYHLCSEECVTEFVKVD